MINKNINIENKNDNRNVFKLFIFLLSSLYKYQLIRINL